MLARLTAIDKVSIVALARDIQAEHQSKTIADLAFRLGVPLMSEWRNRLRIVERLASPPKTPVPEPKAPAVALGAFLIAFLLQRTEAFRENQERRSYAGWFKRLCVECRDRGYSCADIADLTGIDQETLWSFKEATKVALEKDSIDDKSRLVLGAWTGARPFERGTLDRFLGYFARKQPEVAIARDELRQILINLGLHTPRGPKIKNEGAQVKRRFAPHALWEGDGKLIKIRVNGVDVRWIWYAFADQETTLLVGSSMTGTESAASFLGALRDGERSAGLYPIGVLIDNRLGDSDLGDVMRFCKEHGIVLVRTFPGNSKTNGIIEGNFSIFERFVGDMEVSGRTPEELGRSIATAIIEVFTQMRNHSPRARLGGRSPLDVATGVVRPEWARTAIERLAARLNKEQVDADARWQLIAAARQLFGGLSWEDEQKIKRQLVKYPALDVVAAQARFLAQAAKYPEKRYGAEYFLAILRHKREAIAKETYNEAYRAGIRSTLGNAPPVAGATEQEISLQLLAELLDVAELSSPSEQLLRLDAIAWWLASYSVNRSLLSLWKEIEAIAARSISMSLQWWAAIVEYLGERIGKMLYLPGPHDVRAISLDSNRVV